MERNMTNGAVFLFVLPELAQSKYGIEQYRPGGLAIR